MDIINFSKKRLESKHGGRFKVTINKVEAPNSLFVEYEIKIQDFGEEGYVWVYQEKYSGSAPEKRAQQMIESIKRKNVTQTNVYYSD